MAPLPKGLRYRAFLSYSSVDRRQSRWLHRKLEAYRIPRRLVGKMGLHGPVPQRLRPIFLDREDARPGPAVETAIGDELARSEHLIVLCTPSAADGASYVGREIELFRELWPEAKIHAVIGRGAPPACFPKQLLRDMDGAPRQPLAADLRPPEQGGDGRTKAVVKLVAALAGTDVDDLWRRERRRQSVRVAFAAALLAVVTVAGLFWRQELKYEHFRDSVGYLRTIGTSDENNLSPDERTALWELSESGRSRIEVREEILSAWFQTNDSLQKALKGHARGLHAATGLNPDLQKQVRVRLDEAMARLSKELGNPALAASRWDTLNVLVKLLAPVMQPQNVAVISAHMAKIITSPKTSSVQIAELGDTVAALGPMMSHQDAMLVASALMKRLATPLGIADDKLLSLGRALAGLAPQLEPKDAAILLSPVLKALANEFAKKYGIDLSPYGLLYCIDGMDALAARLDPAGARSLARSFAPKLKAEFTKPENPYGVGQFGTRLMRDVAARLAPADAANIAEELLTSMTGAYVAMGGPVVGALLPHLTPEDAGDAASETARVIANQLVDQLVSRPQAEETVQLLSGLSTLLPYLGRQETELYAGLSAESIVRPIENPSLNFFEINQSEWKSITSVIGSKIPLKVLPMAMKRLITMLEKPVAESAQVVRLRDAIIGMAQGMRAEDAAAPASRLAKALRNPQMRSFQTDAINEAVGALARRMKPADASALQALMLEAFDDRLADYDQLAGVARAAALLTTQLDPKETITPARRIAQVAIEQMANPDIPSLTLAQFGKALGTLVPYIPSAGRQIRLLALSSILLEPLRNGSTAEQEVSADGRDVEKLCEGLGTPDLFEILKWPVTVGEARSIVLSVLERKTARTFRGDLANVGEQAASLGIGGLERPPQRPGIPEALGELGARPGHPAIVR